MSAVSQYNAMTLLCLRIDTDGKTSLVMEDIPKGA